MKRLALLIGLISCYYQAMSVDTVQVSRNQILLVKDTIYIPESDTNIVVLEGKYKVRSNPYRTASDFFQKMEAITGQNKVTAQLFDWLYVNKRTPTEFKSKNSRTSNQPFEPYEGLIITKIRIKFVDILEGSVTDTLRRASSSVAKVANRLHVDTWSSVIRNNLLVKLDDQIDPYALADNERIIRRLNFVEDVKIYITPKELGTAELTIVVKDRLSWGVAVNLDNYNRHQTELFNRNIGGSGKFASLTWLYNSNNEPRSGYNIAIGAQNINKSITNWELNHRNNGSNETWGVNIQKEFVAPEVKYGGGLEARWIKDTTLFLDRTPSASAPFSLNFQDLWIGRSFQLPSTNNRKNLIISSRLLNHSFNKQPFVSSDSNFLFYERKIFLSELSLASSKFLKTNYISGFGISEDIPLGYRFSFITGWDFNQFYTQRYYGYQLFWSFYVNNFGYLLLNQEIGAFDRSQLSNGALKIKLNYFTPLWKAGRYYFRNFVRITHTRGLGQPDYRSIDLTDRIRDISGSNISGSSVFASGLESIIYTPWYFYGFRFAPFVYYNIGEVWDVRLENPERFGYQGAGVGLRIKNESLVFNTLEFRLTHFFIGPEDLGNTLFSISSTIPISFENIFKYKPAISAFD